MLTLNNIDNTLIDLALREDLSDPFLDITANTLFANQTTSSTVKIISKEKNDVICCGLALIPAIMSRFTDEFELTSHYQDGDVIKPGETLLTLSSQQQFLSMAERTILNFMQHLSAIATLTHQFVQLIKHTSTKILDTRKTLPGFRHLDKYAVHCGGGVNHRMGLYDAIMIKDNHVDLLGGMGKTLKKLPDDILEHCPVIVEVRNKTELETLLSEGQHKVTRALLDNMSIDELRECVTLCKSQLPTEASGGVNLTTITAIAETGVDYASIGALTHSAGNIDLSMKTT